MNLKEARIKMKNEILNGMKVSFLKCKANFNHLILRQVTSNKKNGFQIVSERIGLKLQA